jgi:hypothetical protein
VRSAPFFEPDQLERVSERISQVSDVKKKYLVRWANAARSAVERCSDPIKKAEIEAAAKRFQIMEGAIKIHRLWVYRSGCQEKAWNDFDTQWRILTQFAHSDPRQTLKCDYLWCLRFQILAASLYLTNLGCRF